VHEADDPNTVVDLLDAEALTGEHCELRFREGSVERSAETTRDDPDGEYLKRNRWFESGSLLHGVWCPDRRHR
jgi:hypothetical protein